MTMQKIEVCNSMDCVLVLIVVILACESVSYCVCDKNRKISHPSPKQSGTVVDHDHLPSSLTSLEMFYLYSFKFVVASLMQLDKKRKCNMFVLFDAKLRISYLKVALPNEELHC